jgi:hypothetical protein
MSSGPRDLDERRAWTTLAAMSEPETNVLPHAAG